MLFTLEETKQLNARAKQRSLEKRSERLKKNETLECVKTDHCVVLDAGVRRKEVSWRRSRCAASGPAVWPFKIYLKGLCRP